MIPAPALSVPYPGGDLAGGLQKTLDDEVLECRANPQYKHGRRPLAWYLHHPAHKEHRVDYSPDLIVRDFVQWSMTDEHLYMKKEELSLDKAQQKLVAKKTDYVYPKCSKRGNDVYSRRLNARMGKLNKSLRYRVISRPIPGFRDNFKMTKVLLITATVDRGSHSRFEAWDALKSKKWVDVRVNSQFDKFKQRIRKHFGNFTSIRSNEATGDGYPAPHTIIILDKEIPVKMHTSTKTGRRSWRLVNYSDKKKIDDAWPLGFVDVEGVVDGSGRKGGWIGPKGRGPLEYITKYISKNLDLITPEASRPEDIEDWFGPWFEDLDKSNRTALYTQAFNWLFGLHAVPVSKQLKDAVNRMRLDNPEGVCKVPTQKDLDGDDIPLVRYEMMGVISSRKCHHCFTGMSGPPPTICIECVMKNRRCRS